MAQQPKQTPKPDKPDTPDQPEDKAPKQTTVPRRVAWGLYSAEGKLIQRLNPEAAEALKGKIQRLQAETRPAAKQRAITSCKVAKIQEPVE